MKTSGILLFFALLFNACDSNNNPFVYQKDAHGRGKAHIYVEESFKPLFSTSIATFESQYPKAKVRATYGAENQIIDAFYANKTKTIVVSRNFNDKEKEYLKSKNVSYRSDKIATDAIVIILHPSMEDTVLSVSQIKKLLSNDNSKLPSNSPLDQIVFDQKGSANFDYLTHMLHSEQLSSRVSALHSNEAGNKYV